MTIDVETLREEGATFLELSAATYAMRDRPDGVTEVLFVDGDVATPVGYSRHGADVNAVVAGHVFERARAARRAGVRPAVADAMRAAGYEAYNSGGGCMVWRKDLGDGTDIYISNESTDGPLDGDYAAQIWLAGRYADSGSSVDVTAGMPLDVALAVAAALPDPVGFDGQGYQIAADSPRDVLASAESRDRHAKAIAARMGYEGAVRAASPAEGVEVCLVEAGRSHYAGWAVVTHEGCDPADDTAGCSGVEEYPDRRAGEDAFLETLARYAAPSLGLR